MRLMFDNILSTFQRTLRSLKQLHHLITSNVRIASVKGKLKNVSTEQLLTTLSQIQLNLVTDSTPRCLEFKFIFRWIRFLSHLLLALHNPRKLNHFLYSFTVRNSGTTFPGMFPYRLGGNSLGMRLEIAGLSILKRISQLKLKACI